MPPRRRSASKKSKKKAAFIQFESDESSLDSEASYCSDSPASTSPASTSKPSPYTLTFAGRNASDLLDSKRIAFSNKDKTTIFKHAVKFGFCKRSLPTIEQLLALAQSLNVPIQPNKLTEICLTKILSWISNNVNNEKTKGLILEEDHGYKCFTVHVAQGLVDAVGEPGFTYKWLKNDSLMKKKHDAAGKAWVAIGNINESGATALVKEAMNFVASNPAAAFTPRAPTTPSSLLPALPAAPLSTPTAHPSAVPKAQAQIPTSSSKKAPLFTLDSPSEDSDIDAQPRFQKKKEKKESVKKEALSPLSPPQTPTPLPRTQNKGIKKERITVPFSPTPSPSLAPAATAFLKWTSTPSSTSSPSLAPAATAFANWTSTPASASPPSLAPATTAFSKWTSAPASTPPPVVAPLEPASTPREQEIQRLKVTLLGCGYGDDEIAAMVDRRLSSEGNKAPDPGIAETITPAGKLGSHKNDIASSSESDTTAAENQEPCKKVIDDDDDDDDDENDEEVALLQQRMEMLALELKIKEAKNRAKKQKKMKAAI
ncbi:hypothetical protein AC578_4353 [Pseudocercospora eumusae]|uniref:Uncharacterized protein n=1 Tax=Pseudocercospora eumusae TaxID=321146 RepID=A0A139H5T6_9PEZI|nr:hypothetical protein AC578_4353 [Pseudocercospora eumusae]